MLVDVQKYRVCYDGRIYRALLVDMIFGEDNDPLKDHHIKPKFLSVTYIDEDCNIATIHDEAWRFQFLPIKDDG